MLIRSAAPNLRSNPIPTCLARAPCQAFPWWRAEFLRGWGLVAVMQRRFREQVMDALAGSTGEHPSTAVIAAGTDLAVFYKEFFRWRWSTKIRHGRLGVLRCPHPAALKSEKRLLVGPPCTEQNHHAARFARDTRPSIWATVLAADAGAEVGVALSLPKRKFSPKKHAMTIKYLTQQPKPLFMTMFQEQVNTKVREAANPGG